MTVTCLVCFLLAALTIALGDRKISPKQFTFWAAHAIAIGMFLCGRML